ncbi:hypothetical protein PanWU01x14_294390, partial [Parasponia andersonii]
VEYECGNPRFGGQVCGPREEGIGHEAVRAVSFQEKVELGSELAASFEEFELILGRRDHVDALDPFGESDLGARDVDGENFDLGAQSSAFLDCLGENMSEVRGGQNGGFQAA